MGAGNNNGIKDGESNNTNRFRMILIPDKNTCKNNELFDSLIKTCEIKALSGFLDKSPWKCIRTHAIDVFKGKKINQKIQQNVVKVKINKLNKGGVYVIYLGGGVFKFGCVEDYSNLKSRMNDHSRSCIQRVKEFTGKGIHNNKVYVIWSKETNLPKGDEEFISKIIYKPKSDKITVYECERSKNKIREYLVCNDFEYIDEYIFNILNNTNT